jgi:hypothetical protein
MKRWLPLQVLAVLSAAVTIRAEVEFVGIFATSQQTLFTLRETSSLESGWRQLGQSFAGYLITGYDAADDSLTLTKDGARTRVRLKDAKVKTARLELAGTFTLGAGEMTEIVRASLVSGEETAFPLKDGLVFRVTPQYRPDGTLLFRAAFERPRADGTVERLAAPSVIVAHGAEFSIEIGEFRFAFKPRAS